MTFSTGGAWFAIPPAPVFAAREHEVDEADEAEEEELPGRKKLCCSQVEVLCVEQPELVVVPRAFCLPACRKTGGGFFGDSCR